MVFSFLVFLVAMVLLNVIGWRLERKALRQQEWLERIRRAIPTLIKASHLMGQTMEEAGRAFQLCAIAIREAGEEMLSWYTEAEITEARDAGVPIADKAISNRIKEYRC